MATAIASDHVRLTRLCAGDLRAPEAASRGLARPSTRHRSRSPADRVRSAIADDILSAHRFIVISRRQTISRCPERLLRRARVRLEQLIDLSLAATTAWKMRDSACCRLPSHALEFSRTPARPLLLGEPIDVVGLWPLGEPIVDAVDYLSSSWIALEALTWSAVNNAWPISHWIGSNERHALRVRRGPS